MPVVAAPATKAKSMNETTTSRTVKPSSRARSLTAQRIRCHTWCSRRDTGTSFEASAGTGQWRGAPSGGAGAGRPPPHLRQGVRSRARGVVGALLHLAGVGGVRVPLAAVAVLATDGVARRRAGDELELDGVAARQVDVGVGLPGRNGRVGVVVLRVVRLDRRDRVADVRLRRLVLRALAVVQVQRDRDGDEDADDHDDHEELDEGEAALAVLPALPELLVLLEHLSLLDSVWGMSGLRPGWTRWGSAPPDSGGVRKSGGDRGRRCG